MHKIGGYIYYKHLIINYLLFDMGQTLFPYDRRF